MCYTLSRVINMKEKEKELQVETPQVETRQVNRDFGKAEIRFVSRNFGADISKTETK